MPPPKRVTALIRERVVLVAVYVETPKKRKRLSSSNNYHRRHISHYDRGSNGSNRRADLLDYSRRLRVSGRSGSTSNPLLLHHHPNPKSSPPSNKLQHPSKQIIPLQSNSKQERSPTCFGNCKTEVPSFFRSFVSQCKQALKPKKRASEPTATQMNIIMKSFQKQKKLGGFSKFFAG